MTIATGPDGEWTCEGQADILDELEATCVSAERQSCAPAKSPCGSCPYRRDVPSGVWAPEEYAKLPAYDRPTQEQPAGLFMCHQQDGRLCAGWVGCHDMTQSLAIRFATLGSLPEADLDAIFDYASPAPLWPSGTEAAEHGLRGVEDPDARARRAIGRLERKATLREGAPPSEAS